MNVQTANDIKFFGKNMAFKNYFSNLYQNPEDLNSGSTVHKSNALDH